MSTSPPAAISPAIVTNTSIVPTSRQTSPLNICRIQASCATSSGRRSSCSASATIRAATSASPRARSRSRPPSQPCAPTLRVAAERGGSFERRRRRAHRTSPARRRRIRLEGRRDVLIGFDRGHRSVPEPSLGIRRQLRRASRTSPAPAPVERSGAPPSARADGGSAARRLRSRPSRLPRRHRGQTASPARAGTPPPISRFLQ